MRTLFVFLISLFFFCGSVSAQNDSVQNPQEVHYDERSGLQPVQFDKDQLNGYKNDGDFDYTRKIDAINWWERFTDWVSYIWNSFWHWLLGDFTAGSWLGILLNVLKYVVIAGIIALIVWLFIKLNPGKAFLKTKTPPEVLLSDEEKIIHEEDIPTLIEGALNQQNYRLAVRYYYLLILKKLKDKNLIDYQFQKTNQEYRFEIADADISKQFGNITRLYDFIWYGDFPVNKSDYAIAEGEFETMQSQLKNLGHV